MASAVLMLASAGAAAGEQDHPFMGDWEGRWTQGRVYPPRIAAQIVPWAEGRYQIHLFTALRKKAPEYVVIEAAPDGDTLRFEHGPWSGTIHGDRFEGKGRLRGRDGSFEMKRTFYESPHLGVRPPKNALILFDGSDFDEWEMVGRDGRTALATWEIVDRAMRIVPELGNHKIGSSLGTKRTFRDFHLHIEFRLPLLPANTDQRRGNSGVIIEDYAFYEVQVLDCYGLPGYYDECGCIYQVAPPKVNMCGMPRQWQSYDITFRAPRFDWAGDLLQKARITVDHNGELIHNGLELPFSDGALQQKRERPDSRRPGRIKLQDHGYPVEYRNIWIVDLTQGQN
jgi:hypothetical protein